MKTRKITTESIEGFTSFLRQKERSDGTIEKYLHDVKIFCSWLDDREVTQELAAEWKCELDSVAGAGSLRSTPTSDLQAGTSCT